jgi:hypothetical protein
MDSCAKAGRTDGVALSGGLDSRAITAALVGRGKNVVTYTFGDPNCNDVKYARMVTKKLNIPHFSASLDQAAFVYQDTDTILRRSDGSLPLNHSHPISLAPYMRNTADTFFDGLTGEVLGAVGLNRHRKTRVTAETAPATLMKHFMLFGDELVRKAMPGVTPAAQRIDRYGYYYSDFGGHKHGTSVVNIWSDVSRQRRFVVNQPRLLEGERRVYCPFWNFDYYQVCSSLPPSDRRLMRPWVILNRKEYPDLVHVPWTRWSLPLWTPIKVGESLINVHELMTYTNYFVHRFTGIRPLGGFQSGFSFYFDWFRVNPTLKAFIQEVLSDPIVDRIPFLSRQGVMAIVDTHMNNITVNYADLIGSLMATVLYIDRCESTPTI